MTKTDKQNSAKRDMAIGNYRVLARKYRPQNFEDLIGQEPMVRTLSNAFQTGRIAQAYMLTGVRGIGKTTTARILARALNFKTEKIDIPSVELSTLGENCQAIIDGNHLDIIEMDAASHTGIDDIRDLIESAQYKPASARFKVYIVDEVHMLSRNAFNGLLKTLEEPPGHLKFIFATTEIRKVPVTVLSRCQRFDLRRIPSDIMTSHLAKIGEQENVTIDAGAMAMLVRASEGSVRDALSLLDQAIAHCAINMSATNIDETMDDKILVDSESVRAMLGLADRARIIDLFEYLMKGDVAACLDEFRNQYDVGAEPGVILSDLANFIHFVTRLKYVPKAAQDPAISESESKKGTEFAASLSVRTLGRAWQILLKGIEEVNNSERPLMAAEMVLVRLAHAASLPTPDELIRISQNAQAANPASTQQNRDTTAIRHDNGPASNHSSTHSSSEETNSGPQSTSPQSTSPQTTSPQTTSLHSNRQFPPAGRMTATNGPNLSIVSGGIAKPDESAPAIIENQQIILNQFDDLIFLAEDKRDLAIKNGLRHHVRLVSFEDGRMEFSLARSPRQNFISDLQQKLKSWTGKRWNLVISREPGAPTLEEVERSEEKLKIDEASTDPVVGAILAKFPGSKVIDVRIRKDEEPDFGIKEELNDVDPGDLADVQDARTLDDFYE